MSRKRAHTRSKPNLERAYTPTYSNAMGIQGDYAKYAGGNSVTIPASIFAQMVQNLAPQKGQAKDFAPGAPLKPYEGVVPLAGPRQWSYIPGSNLTNNDRTLGMPDIIPSFQQLRNFAMLYDAIGLCERVILDMIPQLMPKVGVNKLAAAQGAEDSQYQKDISTWMAFVEKPSPAQGLDIHSWLRMAWTDQTQIDALAIFKHKTRGGGLYGMELIDGSTVKPVLDERGMLPDASQGWPAYQQYPYGVPGDLYTTKQLDYYRESPRTFTPYGFSRIERIIMRVNQALRKEQKDLARWTEGNIPASIIEVPADMNWTPDQIDDFEQRWNSLLAGNYQMQVRAKFLQAGMKYNPIDEVELNTPFDEFLLNLTAASYGLSMQDLAFTGDIHKSSGDSQQNVMYRRTLYPLVSVYARILTLTLREFTGNSVLEVGFSGYEEVEDEQSKATTLTMYTNAGILGLTNAAKLAKLPEDPDAPHIGRVFMSKDGPIFLDDMASDKMRNAAMEAKMAGFTLAANPPEPQEGEGDNEETTQGASAPDSGGKTTGGSKAPQAAKSAASANSDEQPDDGGKGVSRGHDGGGNLHRAESKAETGHLRAIGGGTPDGSDEQGRQTGYGRWEQGSCTCEACTANNGVVRASGEAYPSGHTETGQHDGCDCRIVPVEAPSQQSTIDRLVAQVEALLAQLNAAKPAQVARAEGKQDVSQEYKRWRLRAIEDARANRAQRGFTTTLIPSHIHERISLELEEAQSVEDVKAVFARAREQQESGDLASSIAALFAEVEERGSKELTA